MSLVCYVCKCPERTRGELRPYGPDGQLICFACAMKPERKEETARNFNQLLSAAEDAARPEEGGTAYVVLTKDGPKPVKAGSS